MRGINKVILVGNIGKDPEVRYMPSGGAVTNITVATSEAWKDKTTGESKDRTEWHTVIFYQKLAEIAGQYLKKGSQVYVEGSIRTRKWQDKEGHDRYSTEIIANEMQMLGGKPSEAAKPAAAKPTAQQAERREPEKGFEDDGFNDPIPFGD